MTAMTVMMIGLIRNGLFDAAVMSSDWGAMNIQ